MRVFALFDIVVFVILRIPFSYVIDAERSEAGSVKIFEGRDILNLEGAD